MSTAQPKIPHRPPRTPDRKIGSRPPRAIRSTPNKKWPAGAFNATTQQHHYHHHGSGADADNRSRGSNTSASDSHATPTSVLLRAGSPLTRDLSDLSGSYMGGNTVSYRGRTPSPSGVPVHVYPSDQSDTSYQRPWRHAHVLSSRGPMHPQPPPDEENVEHYKNQIDLVKKSRVMVGPQGLVEVVAYRTDDSVASDSIDSILNGSQANARGSQQRFPLLILLMDPHRKIYEFEQMWIDIETDTVRDVLHALQLSLSDRWRQDYDGLFQVRNQTFNQLIHILNVEKYGVQPLEVWIAKPWAMSAKATIQYANSLLQHLTHLNILSYISNKDYPHTKIYGNTSSSSSVAIKDSEAILTFTTDAASRMYVPGGTVLQHHHAHQFLSFSPPFEPLPKMDILTANALNSSDDVASMISDIQNSSMGSSCGDSMDGCRAVSPLSRTPEDSVLESEPSIIKEITSKPSPRSQLPKPVIQRPKPVPPITPMVPQATFSDSQSSLSEKRVQREQTKIDPKVEGPNRSRISMLFCCRSERENDRPVDSLQRNPTLETVTEWVPYWEDGSAASAISDSRPLLRGGTSDAHIVARTGSRTRSDWC
uniref:Uncharacterized protein n=1 Tax=Amphora coffeiformis TaxID=265554 RepID=A0A7S3LCW2_9STRA|mmetsp:Transcript_22240/g.42230  ORF Transcript_22240/g.42230 Transcript_22240/m.42230 type:complete len:593 (+) Transcript_22240:165-1943(+)|eukprot:scaffold3337_cov169-Amphora_coffeaeformis.AAC.19